MLSDTVYALALIVFGLGAASAVYVLTVHRAVFSDQAHGVFVRLSCSAAIAIAMSAGFLLAYLQSREQVALASGNASATVAALLMWFALRRLSHRDEPSNTREAVWMSACVLVVALIQLCCTMLLPRDSVGPVIVSVVIAVLIAIAAAEAFRPTMRRIHGARWLGLMLAVSAGYFLVRAGVAAFHPDSNEPVRDPFVLGGFAIVLLFACTLSTAAMARQLRIEEEHVDLRLGGPVRSGESAGVLLRGYRVQAIDMPLMEVAHGYELIIVLQRQLQELLTEVAPIGSQLRSVSDDGYVLVSPAQKGDMSDRIREMCATDCSPLQDLTGLTIEIRTETGTDADALVQSLSRRYPRRASLSLFRRLEKQI